MGIGAYLKGIRIKLNLSLDDVERKTNGIVTVRCIEDLQEIGL